MHVFTTYVAAWMPDIQVDISTGTRPRYYLVCPTLLGRPPYMMSDN